jgi:hypothetical protein
MMLSMLLSHSIPHTATYEIYAGTVSFFFLRTSPSSSQAD